jgi:hypothetical protein
LNLKCLSAWTFEPDMSVCLDIWTWSVYLLGLLNLKCQSAWAFEPEVSAWTFEPEMSVCLDFWTWSVYLLGLSNLKCLSAWTVLPKDEGSTTFQSREMLTELDSITSEKVWLNLLHYCYESPYFAKHEIFLWVYSVNWINVPEIGARDGLLCIRYRTTMFN